MTPVLSELVIHRLEGAETVVARFDGRVEAPNWTRDGTGLICNRGGRLFRIAAAGGRETRIDTGFATACNNDHGLSPDGSTLAISDQSRTEVSCIYLVPASGGEPKRVTALTPSWWHGWSPDGEQLAYTGRRNDRYGIYACSLDGSGERLVIGGDGPHYDGPDYSADGRWIWFNSNRGGRMQLWRIPAEGGAAEPMTKDERTNWFAHPSPDGKHVVYLSYAPGVEGHPADRDVELRLMPAGGGTSRRLVSLRGGQGTINVPSWSPDSSAFAYIRYPETETHRHGG